MELTFNQIKELCRITGDTPTELCLDDWLLVPEDNILDTLKEHIAQSVCFFNADFLSYHTGLEVETIKAIQERYEDSNEDLIRLINAHSSFEDFIDDAVSRDGAGHFLSPYDGNEYELRASDGSIVYAYRQN